MLPHSLPTVNHPLVNSDILDARSTQFARHMARIMHILPVKPKLIRWLVWISTRPTCKSLFFYMDRHMTFEVSFLIESGSTLIANELTRDVVLLPLWARSFSFQANVFEHWGHWILGSPLCLGKDCRTTPLRLIQLLGSTPNNSTLDLFHPWLIQLRHIQLVTHSTPYMQNSHRQSHKRQRSYTTMYYEMNKDTSPIDYETHSQISCIAFCRLHTKFPNRKRNNGNKKMS
jgi:hypothetical protein